MKNRRRFQSAGCTGAFEDLLFLHEDLAYEVLWSVVRMLSTRLRETNDNLTFVSVSGKFE